MREREMAKEWIIVEVAGVDKWRWDDVLANGRGCGCLYSKLRRSSMGVSVSLVQLWSLYRRTSPSIAVIRCTAIEWTSACIPKARTVTYCYTRMRLWTLIEFTIKFWSCVLICQSYKVCPDGSNRQGWQKDIMGRCTSIGSFKKHGRCIDTDGRLIKGVSNDCCRVTQQGSGTLWPLDLDTILHDRFRV